VISVAEVALHLELLEVFGEIDLAGIKLLHLVLIMMPVRVIVPVRIKIQRGIPYPPAVSPLLLRKTQDRSSI
jgi:hypothetical protein